MLGNIYQPVIKGEIQNNGLGMDVGVYSEKGNLLFNKKGEEFARIVGSIDFTDKKFIKWLETYN